MEKETFKNLKLPKEIEQNGNDDNSNEIWIPNEDGFDTNYSNKGKMIRKNTTSQSQSQSQRQRQRSMMINWKIRMI